MCLPDDQIPGNAGLLDQVSSKASLDNCNFVQFNLKSPRGRFDWINIDHKSKTKLQLLALEWIHDHIADFGGDPDRVTIMVNISAIIKKDTKDSNHGASFEHHE